VLARAAPLVLLATLGLPSPAHANPFGYREHDGFYLRVSAGIAALHVERSTAQEGSLLSLAYAGEGSSVGGGSLFSEVSIGGTPLPGVVFAGTLLADGLPATDIRTASGARVALGSALVFTMLGPTVDFFPDRARGFHVGGGAGFATSTAGVSDPVFNTIGGLGFGLTASVGYDLWVADDWSVGVLGRGMLARIQGEEQSGQAVGREHDTVSSASLAVSLLYH
jgi:hypothetical protein